MKLLLTVLLFATIAESQEPAKLTASEIFHRLDQQNAIRAAKLRAYMSQRRYSVYEPNHPDDAALTASMKFVAPSTKTFTVTSQNGVGWIHKRVFQGLMQAEQDSGQGKQKTDSSISSANYDSRLVGEEQVQGRNCYVLELQPRREDKYLFRGKIWVDQQDFAITKLEGEPMKSPSIFVTRAHLVRQYQKIGDFWLQLSDETHCQIRFVGEYVLRIDYSDYKLDVAG